MIFRAVWEELHVRTLAEAGCAFDPECAAALPGPPCLTSVRRTCLHGRAIRDRIRRMYEHALAGGEAAADFGGEAVVVGDFDLRLARLVAIEHESHPVAATAEELGRLSDPPE